MKFLYYFSNDDIDLIELKRIHLDSSAPISEIYKWIYHTKKTGQLTELVFESMSKSEEFEIRTFEDAVLRFDSDHAKLKIGEVVYDCERKGGGHLPEALRALLQRTFGPK